MEKEAKKPLAMYEVPDVKSKMKTGAPAAKWMEARKLMIVNSYFVKDIQGYGRETKTVVESEKTVNVTTLTKDASSDHDSLAVKSNIEIEEIQLLSFCQLGLFCSPLIFFLFCHLWFSILPALKLTLFVGAVLACCCFVMYHEDGY